MCVISVLGSCKSRNKSEGMIKSLDIPSLEEAIYCLNATKRITCQLFHPVCLNATVNNKIEIIKSSICYEACDIAYNRLCHKSMQAMRAINKLKLLCPGIDLVNTRKLILPNCIKHGHRYMHSLGDCQMHNIFGIDFIH